MFTHVVKSSNQKCFQAVWWPSKDESVGSREKRWPLMMLESGQITRIRADNLKKIAAQ